MSFYKLVPPRGRSDISVDEIVFKGDDGEKKSVSVSAPSELTDSEVGQLSDAGYQLAESNPPSEESGQIVGADVAGMSPVIGQSATNEPTVSQTGMQQVQQGAAEDNAPAYGEYASETDQPQGEGVNE